MCIRSKGKHKGIIAMTNTKQFVAKKVGSQTWEIYSDDNTLLGKVHKVFDNACSHDYQWEPYPPVKYCSDPEWWPWGWAAGIRGWRPHNRGNRSYAGSIMHSILALLLPNEDGQVSEFYLPIHEDGCSFKNVLNAQYRETLRQKLGNDWVSKHWEDLDIHL